jgi:hypothetical protein
MSSPLGGVTMGAGAVGTAGAVAVGPGGPGASGADGSFDSGPEDAPHATSANTTRAPSETPGRAKERDRNAPMSDASLTPEMPARKPWLGPAGRGLT